MRFRYLTFPLGVLVSLLAISTNSCTKLDEEVLGSKFVDTLGSGGSGGIATAADLIGVYDELNQFADQANAYALTEHPSDEMMGPTRGTDWDDFGKWRKLHLHTWDGATEGVVNAWNNLNKAAYKATVVTEKATDIQIKSEAAFLRAFFSYQVCDLYGQVPYRASNADPDADPKVFSRKDAVTFIETDLQTAITNLPSVLAPGKATSDAAKFLLAKLTLNKAVFIQDPSQPAGPFTFVAADMNKVISLCNDIIASNRYQLADAGKYWDNFKWDNKILSKELIFTRENTSANQPANCRNRTYMGFHYNQTPGGWNGFTTLADFYNSFEATDIRRGITLPVFTDSLGYGTGFLIGQQFGPKRGVGDGADWLRNNDSLKTRKMFALKQRDGNPLSFTQEVNLSASTEAAGIRVVKYPLDPSAIDASTNSYIFFRYADVLLMKAEAILRGGTDPNGQTALGIVNDLRSKRGLANLTSLDESKLLAERGHELYYEGWRRNDQIRFGKFNDPVNERPIKSAATRVLFAIPYQAVATNPNLKQNAGY